MKDVAIKVDNLTKVYHLYEDPVDRLKEALHPLRKKYHRDFYALNNLSFAVKKGEAVGIVGKNGSGKSTLLKILAGVLTPTGGGSSVVGRVTALLELGAGFNPELTGLENVYFYGSLIGFSREQMSSKVDDILAFADIGDFIHQPVKVYSSGMFVRLAFAVAISVAPDVLIIDEALSVGDLAFRNKCMDRIASLRNREVTIVFVTHDLSTLQMFCDRVIWMEGGRIREDGEPVAVAQAYSIFMTGSVLSVSDMETEQIIPQQDTGMAEFVSISFNAALPGKSPLFETGQDIKFKFSLLAKQPLEEAIFAVSVYRADGDWVLGQTSREMQIFWPAALPGETKHGELVLLANCLAPGDYLAAFACYSRDLSLCYAMTDASLAFSVRSGFPTWGKFVHPCSWKET